MSHADILRLHVEVEAVVAAVTADAARLHAAERRRQMAVVLGVDPDHAGIERARESMRAADVVCPEIPGQAIAHVVRERERFIFIGERNHGEHGPEDLFLRDTHLIVRAGEHRGLYVVAALCRGAAADRYRSTLAARHAEVAEHLLDVLGMNERPELRARIERMTHLELADTLD